MDLQSIKTPGLILDIERVKKNAARISDIAKRNNVRLRPHVKTHKSVCETRILGYHLRCSHRTR